MVSELFDPAAWRAVDVDGFGPTDITYHRALAHGTVRIAINRPEVRNAFRPRTVDELYRALDHARQSPDVGCVLLTGNGPSPKDGGWAFSSGGDQRVRGKSGYEYGPDEPGAAGPVPEAVPEAGSGSGSGSGPGSGGASERARLGRLHILQVQQLIRFMPKVVIAVVPGWAAGGGHSLHVVCDLTLASAEHARFRQTDADVASFDGGYGSAYLARQIGQKRAREVFFLGRTYDAEEAARMGMVNAVVPHADLETVALEWAGAVNAKSPMSVRMLKYAFNLADDGLVGQQLFAGEATRLAYMTEEAGEGRDAFLGGRAPDWSAFPWYY
jgi:naphthoate synthase